MSYFTPCTERMGLNVWLEANTIHYKAGWSSPQKLKKSINNRENFLTGLACLYWPLRVSLHFFVEWNRGFSNMMVMYQGFTTHWNSWKICFRYHFYCNSSYSISSSPILFSNWPERSNDSRIALTKYSRSKKDRQFSLLSLLTTK